MIVVFLGPTLRVAEARAILDADYRPPAAMGDVYDAVADGATTIAIVDGVFERVPAVWHKEILWALARRVRVVGSSSMGALRAAELHVFGMEGIGRIFADYRDGALVADDAVAVAHGAAEDAWRPSSDAFVNLRHGLAEAAARGIVSAETQVTLEAIARATFYPERSWARLVADGRARGIAAAELDALHAFVRAERPNLKRDDALALLAAIADPARERAPAPSFAFEPTQFFQALARSRAPAPHGDADAALVHSRAGGPGRDDVRRDALTAHLVDAEARRRGIEAPPARVAAVAERYRRERGLLTAAATHAWLAARGLTHEDFSDAMRSLALADELCVALRGAVDARAPLASALRGEAGALADAAARQTAR